MRRRVLALTLAMSALAARWPLLADDNAPPLDKLDRSAEWLNDKSVHMIAIEVLVVEVNEGKTRDLGVHYGFASDDVDRVVQGADILFGSPLTAVSVPKLVTDPLGQTSVGFTPKLPGLGINLAGMNVGSGVMSLKLRLLLDQGQAKIMTRPIILALSGTSTVLQVGTKVPYQDIDTLGKLIVSEGNVGLNMEVKPTILDLANQTVELDITKVEVSSLSNFITTQNVNRPVFDKADTRTKVTLKGGETFQLSSLKGRRTIENREGIPVLMHIPYLGRLFSSHHEVIEAVDVLFFVTPHIVPPGQNVLLPYDFQHGKDLVQQGLALPEK